MKDKILIRSCDGDVKIQSQNNIAYKKVKSKFYKESSIEKII